MQQTTDNMRKASLAVSVFLTILGVVFSVAAISSPAWEVVHIREFQSEHEHGLWIDCARTVNMKPTKNNDGLVLHYGERHCTYKFDYSSSDQTTVDIFPDENTPDAENVNHRKYKAYQVVYLFLIGIAVVCGIVACMATTCARFVRHTVLILCTASFISGVLSFAVVVSYFFISHSGENRFVKGIIGTYETNIGTAFYCELISAVLFFMSFVISIVASKVKWNTQRISSYTAAQRNNARTLESTETQDMFKIISPGRVEVSGTNFGNHTTKQFEDQMMGMLFKKDFHSVTATRCEMLLGFETVV